MRIDIRITGGAEAEKLIKLIPVTAVRRMDKLVISTARKARDMTKNQIRYGNYQRAGRWIQAKKGHDRALLGVAEKVYYKKIGKNEAIVDVNDPRYNLEQHHRGFTEPADGRKYTIPLVDPSPLGLPEGIDTFTFMWNNASKVPARDIIPSETFMAVKLKGVVIGWTKNVVKEAIAKSGVKAVFS